MARYCIHHCSGTVRILIKDWIYKRHTISRPNGQAMVCLSRQLNCWSLRCSRSTACRCFSIYIFILNIIPGFNRLHKNNCKTRRETFKFWDLFAPCIRDLTLKSGHNLLVLKKRKGSPLFSLNPCFSAAKQYNCQSSIQWFNFVNPDNTQKLLIPETITDDDIEGLVQETCNSSVLAKELIFLALTNQHNVDKEYWPCCKWNSNVVWNITLTDITCQI